jgi:hypothetical protein
LGTDQNNSQIGGTREFYQAQQLTALNYFGQAAMKEQGKHRAHVATLNVSRVDFAVQSKPI